MSKDASAKKKVVIVIPIHSPSPSAYELISFRQCFAILGNHPIVVLSPEGMSVATYREVVADFNVLTIDPKWQANVLSYNKLKTSRFFYSLFKEYLFLLTYELDAFVFKDELLYWCDKNFDYIGAPWFENYNEDNPKAKLIGVGNSGFSLRNVQSARKILQSIYYKNPLEYEVDLITLCKARLKSPLRWLMNQFGENYTVQKNFHYHEDVFFSEIAPAYNKDYRVAPIEEAKKFSFELNPRLLYNLNNNELPMGCHAWWRYGFDFWKPHVESFGYSL
jgi:hypothetical protein